KRRLRLTARKAVRITAIAVLVLIVAVAALMPVINGQLTGLVTRRIAAQMTIPGAGPPSHITLGGGWLLPQVLTGKLSDVQLSLPDATMGCVRHAAIGVTLRGVSQSGTGAHADSIDVSTRLAFASLPAQPGLPKASFARAADGSLAVHVMSNRKLAANLVTKVFVKLELNGDTLTAVPQELMLFGRLLRSAKIASVTGRPRVTHLQALPAGLAYRSITPEHDGLHVALGGIDTTALSALPASVGGRTVSYSARHGLLGITTRIPLLVTHLPLTIWVKPTLSPRAITMVPQSVEILGKNHPPSDLLAKLVLSQIGQSQLSRKLPALPAGVSYRSVSVDGAGVHVAVGGVTVRPFSGMASGTPGATFSAQHGLLVTTVKGMPASAKPISIEMLARPEIMGGALVIHPAKFIILGTVYPARDVMRQVTFPSTRYPLPALPAHLAYTGISVLPSGLRVSVSGQNVTLGKTMFGTARCATKA
ncbi:MAG TPA: LmeA family phospholipid-binding protein, partial [Streptosporangiaceae bacterium]